MSYNKDRYSRGSGSGAVFPGGLTAPKAVRRERTGVSSLTASRSDVHSVLGSAVSAPTHVPEFKGKGGAASDPFARRSSNPERAAAFAALGSALERRSSHSSHVPSYGGSGGGQLGVGGGGYGAGHVDAAVTEGHAAAAMGGGGEWGGGESGEQPSFYRFF